MQASVGGYYAWRKRDAVPPSKTARLAAEILAAHSRTRGAYGAERLHQELVASGCVVSLWKVKPLRRELGLTCTRKRRVIRTTDSNHALPVAPNLLNRDFAPGERNRVWVSDITYVPTRQGWVYLAGIKDLEQFNFEITPAMAAIIAGFQRNSVHFAAGGNSILVQFHCEFALHSREIVGFSLAERMDTGLVLDALTKAVRLHRPPMGLILHSDRGSQYCSAAYQEKLRTYGLTCSMSTPAYAFSHRSLYGIRPVRGRNAPNRPYAEQNRYVPCSIRCPQPSRVPERRRAWLLQRAGPVA